MGAESVTVLGGGGIGGGAFGCLFSIEDGLDTFLVAALEWLICHFDPLVGHTASLLLLAATSSTVEV